MAKVLADTAIKIGREPVVVMPLRQWEQIRDMLVDIEDAERFSIAWNESRKERKIGLKALGKKYNL